MTTSKILLIPFCVFALVYLWCIARTVAITAWKKGASATFYGNNGYPFFDSYSLDDGTCSCKKAREYGVCYNDHCFEYIKDPRMTAAINTPGRENTRMCGKCVEIRCVRGKNRGFISSLFDWRNPCYDSNKRIVVSITDSCPTWHANPSNAQHCNYNKGTHFDLSYWAFIKLADAKFGVIDIEYRFIECSKGMENNLGIKWSKCCDGKRQCIYGNF